MARTSVTVSDQKASAAFVASATTIYRDAVVAGLLAHNAVLQPEDRIDGAVLQQFMTWLGKLLQQKGETLNTAEAAYVSEQADDVPVRIERDAQHDALDGQVTLVRDRVEAHAGRGSLATYGLSRRKPRTAQDLLTYAQTATKLMREQPLMVPDGMGGSMSTVALADSLDGLCGALSVSIQQIVTEQRELDAARDARNTAQDELVAMYQMIAGLLAYVFRLAGYPDLAERVRPVVRPGRRNRTTPPKPDDDAAPLPGTGAPAPGDVPVAAPAQPAAASRRRRRTSRRRASL